MIKGAIFDIDGTLLDSMPVWENAGARYLATLGIKARSDLKERLGKSGGMVIEDIVKKQIRKHKEVIIQKMISVRW